MQVEVELAGKSAHRTREEEEESVGIPLQGYNIQIEQMMGFGRWNKFTGLSDALNADKGCLKLLIGPGTSNLTNFLTYLRLGEECSVLLFQSPALVSGIPPAQMCQELSLSRQTEITAEL